MIADEQTIPLPNLDPSLISRERFNAYLQQHHLTIRDVALEASLRLVYVWKVSRGEPIEPRYAAYIRAALYRLTREPYRELIAVIFAPAEQRHG